MESFDNFLQTYKELDSSRLDTLDTIYTEDAVFIDPAHRLEGLAQLKKYFSSLYSNIHSISFEFKHPLAGNDEAYVQWDMTFNHAKLARGRTIKVAGTSFLQFAGSGKVNFHQDYFDLGGMLYEQLPIMGMIITRIKRRLGS